MRQFPIQVLSSLLFCALLSPCFGSQTLDFRQLIEGYRSGYEKALGWYQKAAEKNHAEALYNLGVLHYLGLGTSQDAKLARSILLKSANQGYPRAQTLLGILLWKGEGGATEISSATSWLEKGSSSESTLANLALGALLEEQGQTRKALELYERAAVSGSTEARFRLGQILLTGPQELQNPRKGAQWIMKAAEAGHSEAQFNAGVLSLEGSGVEVNRDDALRWFLLASKSGDPEAQFQVGLLFEFGQSEEESKKKAVRWYRKAAIQGHREAQARLGYLYLNDEEVERDGHDAFKWNQRSAEQGHPRAQYNLSHLLFRGVGTSKDLVKSLAWMILANQAKLTEAARALPLLRQQLSPSEVEQAVKLAALGPLRIFGKPQGTSAPAAGISRVAKVAVPAPQKAPPKEKSLEEKAAGGDPEAQFQLGMKKGGVQNKEGLQWIEKAANSKHQGAINAILAVEYKKADTLYQAANNTETIALMEKALKLDENSFQTLLRLTKAHNSLGLDLDSEGKKEAYQQHISKTIEYAEKMKAVDPNKGEPYLYLAIGNGNMAKLKGGREKVKIGSLVESFCKDAIKRDPSLGMAHAVLATYYINVAALPWLLKAFAKTFLGKLPDVTQDDALKLYNDAIKADPQLIYAYNKLGLVNKHLENKEEARRWYQKTLELKPRNSQDRRTQQEAAKNLKDL
jgi:uncharacterized protein